MLGEVMEHYGIARSFRDAGYFETEHHRRVSQELNAAIRRGGLIALCGIVGCGKTTLLARTMDALQQEGEILVSRSLAVDKVHVNLKTLIMALFYDLTVEDEVKVPVQAERRERLLLSLIVLAPGLDDLEPRLARHGYTARILAQELDIRQAEARSFLRRTLPPSRTEEIHKQLLAKGIPA